MLQAVSSSTIDDILWSDHAPVSITVVEENASSMTYVWRANSSLFLTPTHVTSLTNQLKEYFALNTDSVSDPMALWCTHKAFIRGILLQTSSRIKKQRTLKLDLLLKDIKSLEIQNKVTMSTVLANKLIRLRSELRLILLEQHDQFINLLTFTQQQQWQTALNTMYKASKCVKSLGTL